MQIGGETIEILLVDILLEKKTFKNIHLKTTHFQVFFIWEWFKLGQNTMKPYSCPT